MLEDGPTLHDLAAHPRGIPAEGDHLEPADGGRDECMARTGSSIRQHDVVVREAPHQETTSLDEDACTTLTDEPTAGASMQGFRHGNLVAGESVA